MMNWMYGQFSKLNSVSNISLPIFYVKFSKIIIVCVYCLSYFSKGVVVFRAIKFEVYLIKKITLEKVLMLNNNYFVQKILL